jgi:pyrimidine-specific ribonucleoside hydrolase
MRDVVSRVVLDVDTGIDDALALLYAVAHPELDLGAVTCVSGNVSLRQVVRNTCFVLDLAQATAVPVGPGANATLLGQGPRLGHRHGANGLGDLPVQASGREPQPDTAVELLSDRLRHAEQPVTLLALAPPDQPGDARAGSSGADRWHSREVDLRRRPAGKGRSGGAGGVQCRA